MIFVPLEQPEEHFLHLLNLFLMLRPTAGNGDDTVKMRLDGRRSIRKALLNRWIHYFLDRVCLVLALGKAAVGGPRVWRLGCD